MKVFLLSFLFYLSANCCIGQFVKPPTLSIKHGRISKIYQLEIKYNYEKGEIKDTSITEFHYNTSGNLIEIRSEISKDKKSYFWTKFTYTSNGFIKTNGWVNPPIWFNPSSSDLHFETPDKKEVIKYDKVYFHILSIDKYWRNGNKEQWTYSYGFMNNKYKFYTSWDNFIKGEGDLLEIDPLVYEIVRRDKKRILTKIVYQYESNTY